MEYDPTKNYQHRKPEIVSRSYNETLFHHTSSPKLPIKHIKLRLFYGVGVETVYDVWGTTAQRQFPYT